MNELKELRDAAYEYKTEVTSAMVMDPRPPVRTMRNFYAGLLNHDRIQAAHDRLLAAIKVADDLMGSRNCQRNSVVAAMFRTSTRGAASARWSLPRMTGSITTASARLSSRRMKGTS